MNASKVVAAIGGRRTKWVVLVLWLVVLGVAGPLGMRLTEVQSNDSSAWLPEGAESTRILAVLPAFQPDNTVQAIVVYERASGLTALVHPLTDDDVADHTSLARWIGEPLPLDHSVLDRLGSTKALPVSENQIFDC